MHPFKRKFKTSISAKELTQIEDWWQKLSPENQNALHDLMEMQEERDERTVSIQLCGRFVEQEQVRPSDVFWVNHFYDYIINHELNVQETFHVGGICSATRLAEQSIRSGYFPANYQCPLQKANCIMVQLIARQNRKKGLALYIQFELLENKS